MTENNTVSQITDEIDLRILSLLQEDSKQTIKNIATSVGKGISAVHARINTLFDSKVIQKYTAVLDPIKMGRPTLAFILVTVRYRVPGSKNIPSQRELCKEISKHPYVLGVHVVSGEYDVLLKTRTANIEELNRFIIDFLRPIPAVEKTLTMFSMDSYYDSLELRNLV